MDVSVVRFNRKKTGDFVSVLRTRVNQYFVDNKISKFGNFGMVLKSIFMISLYMVPFMFLLFGEIQSYGMMMLMWSLMGLGMCGIGLAVMHDANHGAYSKHKWINKIMGYLLNLVGSYHVTWKIQHNVLHHSSTNVHDFDEDLDNQILRFSPHQKRQPWHAYQAYFAPLLYGILSLYKTFSKDFEQVVRFNKKKLLASQGSSLRKMVFQITVNKILYLLGTVALPIYILDFPWWQIISGYMVMHIICGMILALVFQSAHVQEVNDFFKSDEKGNVDNCYAVHQLNTTANFGINSKLLTWLVGGLNFQIEHHLFPHICHVHYKAISGIVQETAEEFHVKYKTYSSFGTAVWSHFKMLDKLGKA